MKRNWKLKWIKLTVYEDDNSTIQKKIWFQVNLANYFFFGCSNSVCKFLGQGLNPWHNSDPSWCSDNAESLTHCTIRKFLFFLFFFKADCSFFSLCVCCVWFFNTFYWSIIDLQSCFSFYVYSKVNQLYIFPFLFRFFSHIGNYIVLSRLPYAIE